MTPTQRAVIRRRLDDQPRAVRAAELSKNLERTVSSNSVKLAFYIRERRSVKSRLVNFALSSRAKDWRDGANRLAMEGYGASIARNGICEVYCRIRLPLLVRVSPWLTLSGLNIHGSFLALVGYNSTIPVAVLIGGGFQRNNEQGAR